MIFLISDFSRLISISLFFRVVSNPTLVFSGNEFLDYKDEVLSFPGASNVPMGSLTIKDNKVKCDCKRLKVKYNK